MEEVEICIEKEDKHIKHDLTDEEKLHEEIDHQKEVEVDLGIDQEEEEEVEEEVEEEAEAEEEEEAEAEVEEEIDIVIMRADQLNEEIP